MIPPEARVAHQLRQCWPEASLEAQAGPWMPSRRLPSADRGERVGHLLMQRHPRMAAMEGLGPRTPRRQAKRVRRWTPKGPQKEGWAAKLRHRRMQHRLGDWAIQRKQKLNLRMAKRVGRKPRLPLRRRQAARVILRMRLRKMADSVVILLQVCQQQKARREARNWQLHLRGLTEGWQMLRSKAAGTAVIRWPRVQRQCWKVMLAARVLRMQAVRRVAGEEGRHRRVPVRNRRRQVQPEPRQKQLSWLRRLMRRRVCSRNRPEVLRLSEPA